MFIFDILITRCNQKWLENFSLAISMIAGMGVVALISYFNPEAYQALTESSATLLESIGGII